MVLASNISRVCAIVFFLASAALAATPTSFCKCTCFGSYKIIPLDARPDSSSPGSADTSPNRLLLSRKLLTSKDEDDTLASLDEEEIAAENGDLDGDNSDGGDKKVEGGEEEEVGDRKEYRQKNCNDCNRVFCLEQNLPECKDAEQGDVFATCFQRDSSKDEAVVFIFLFTTIGLLGWAMVKPCLDGFNRRRRERNEYIPVSDQQR